MVKKLSIGLILSVILALIALPVMAAPPAQGSGGVHFGPYTLEEGDSVSGDLTVFGGPVTLKEDAEFDGDLTVFGPANIEEGAIIDGSLVVMGEADISGTIEGDVFVAGNVVLGETSTIEGDVAAVGSVQREEGSVVEGDLVPVDEEDFEWDWNLPIDVPAPIRRTPARHWRTPMWLRGLKTLFRSIASIVIMGLLALVIISIWPQQTERVGRALMEAPLTAFGMGLLVFLIAAIVLTILLITICLSPFALLGWVIIGVAVLLGWVALGLILGRRILVSVFDQPEPTMVNAAVFGTALLSFILAISRVLGPIRGLLIFVLVPAAAGAVLLTRFGSMPYATQGRTSGSSSTASGATSRTTTTPPPPPAPTPPPPVSADADVVDLEPVRAGEEEEETPSDEETPSEGETPSELNPFE
jgi:cytoskeletal protein CcmA (bactofilin family)